MPYVYPTPDPVKQAPNFGPVLPLEKQDNIKLLTYTAIEAAERGKGWEYLDQVSRMMWNGTVKDWTTGTHLRDAINRAGLDGDKLIQSLGSRGKGPLSALWFGRWRETAWQPARRIARRCSR